MNVRIALHDEFYMTSLSSAGRSFRIFIEPPLPADLPLLAHSVSFEIIIFHSHCQTKISARCFECYRHQRRQNRRVTIASQFSPENMPGSRASHQARKLRGTNCSLPLGSPLLANMVDNLEGVIQRTTQLGPISKLTLPSRELLLTLTSLR